MRRDVSAGGAELGDRILHVRHAGVVQEDHVGQTALVPLAEIGGRNDVGSDRGVWREVLHIRDGPGQRDGAPLRISTTGTRCKRTNRHINTQKPARQRQSNFFKNEPGHYSLLAPAAQSADRFRYRILPECVRNASLRRSGASSREAFAFVPGRRRVWRSSTLS